MIIEFMYFIALALSVILILTNIIMMFKRKEAMRNFGMKCSNVKNCGILKRPPYAKFDAFGCPYYKTCEKFNDAYCRTHGDK